MLSREEYYPYGATAYAWSATGGAEFSVKRYRYSGKECDSENGLYYFGARYYAAWLGRWTAGDPTFHSGRSAFEFCSCAPVGRRDPDGQADAPAVGHTASTAFRNFLAGADRLSSAAARKEREYHVAERAMGVARIGQASLEYLTAAALAAAPEPTMLTKAAAVGVGLHASDTMATGLLDVATGGVHDTLTKQATVAVTKRAGASNQAAQNVGTLVDFAASLVGPAAAARLVPEAVAGSVSVVRGTASAETQGSIVASEEAAATRELGKLTSTGPRQWKSSAGLIYGEGLPNQVNRVEHVLMHTVPNPSKTVHTVFNVARDKVLGLVDEAWLARGAPVPGDPGAFIVPMGRVVGTAGETAVKVIVMPGTSEILTSYPVQL